jgi:hypothetical protein
MKNVSIITRAGFVLFCATLLLVSIGSNTRAAEKILIGFSQATMNSAWRVAMPEGNKKYAAEHYPDVELVFTDGQNQAAKQPGHTAGPNATPSRYQREDLARQATPRRPGRTRKNADTNQPPEG